MNKRAWWTRISTIALVFMLCISALPSYAAEGVIEVRSNALPAPLLNADDVAKNGPYKVQPPHGSQAP
jgi:hypothetical protein